MASVVNTRRAQMQGNRVNNKKGNAKAPRRPRTAKTPCLCSNCPTLPVTISHPNRQYGVQLTSWRSFFASARPGVAPLVIHPIALVGDAAIRRIQGIGAPFEPGPRQLKSGGLDVTELVMSACLLCRRHGTQGGVGDQARDAAVALIRIPARVRRPICGEQMLPPPGGNPVRHWP